MLELPDSRNLQDSRLAPHITAGQSPKLFSEGDLANFLIERWKLASAELQAARTAGPENESKSNFTVIVDRHRLITPSLLTDFEIIEHGWRDATPTDQALPRPATPENFASHGDYIQAQIAYLEGRLKHLSSRRSYIILEVPFEGDRDLLRFRPPGCTGMNAQGWLNGQAIQMKFERKGSEDNAWKGTFRIDLQTIDRFLIATSEAVNEFNNQLVRL